MFTGQESDVYFPTIRSLAKTGKRLLFGRGMAHQVEQEVNEFVGKNYDEKFINYIQNFLRVIPGSRSESLVKEFGDLDTPHRETLAGNDSKGHSEKFLNETPRQFF